MCADAESFSESDCWVTAALEALCPMLFAPSVHALLLHPFSQLLFAGPTDPSSDLPELAPIRPLAQLIAACKLDGGGDACEGQIAVLHALCVLLCRMRRSTNRPADVEHLPIAAMDTVMRTTVEQFRQEQGIQLLSSFLSGVHPAQAFDKLRLLACTVRSFNIFCFVC